MNLTVCNRESGLDIADVIFEYFIIFGRFNFKGKIIPKLSTLLLEAFLSKSRFVMRNG